MRRAVEGKDFTAYNEGWVVDCNVVVWRSADGRRHGECGEQTSARTKADAVREMRAHIREAHREEMSR